MEQMILGKTGLKVSRMGFGGIPIQKTDAKTTGELMRELVNSGVNFIDTARGYTVSEAFLGEALEGIRDQFIVATKSMARTAEEMAKDIDTSLRNLRTKYIDLYQVHNPNVAQLDQVLAPGGALEALLDAKRAGKIGHIGITAHSLEIFERALEMSWVETIMFPYNIVETQAEALIQKCKQKNIGFICMKPLAGGALENADLALRFIASNPNVSVVIPGMESIAQISQNASAVQNTSPLLEIELQEIASIRSSLGTQFCRRCNYCAPCREGINIPGVFLFEGYYTRYKLEQWATERYLSMSKTASDCIGCGACEDRCPYQLPIREMMKKAVSVFGK